MQCDGAEYCDAVDVAVEDFTGEEEEGSIKDDVQESTVEVTIVHEMLIDLRKGIQHGQGLFASC